MNKDTIRQATEIIHQSGKFFYVAATGGGTSFLGEFLKIPGGSSVIVGGEIPYNQKAFDAFAGKTEKYSDRTAALKLAVASFEKCVKLGFDKESVVGVGVACSLAKLNERADRKHHINIAIHLYNHSFANELVLPNNLYTREQEETLVNNLIYYTLFTGYFTDKSKIEPNIIDQITGNFNTYFLNVFNVGTVLNDYIGNPDITQGESVHFHNRPESNLFEKAETIAVYPGSFAPLHTAHIEIYNSAKQILSPTTPVLYELSITNSYKPSIDFVTLKNRVDQFTNIDQHLMVTRAPRFVDKIRLYQQYFPNKKFIFVCGADTWNRVFDAAAIQNGDIQFFKDNDVKFLVFARPGETLTNSDSELMIKNEAALQYNNSISSSELRKKQTQS
jgi:nicotinic acid mononucleotide adenylyltransferase